MKLETAKKLLTGVPLDDKEVNEILQHICETESYSCYEGCPVYCINGERVPNYKQTKNGCDCFKDGKAMADFILNYDK